MFIDFNITLFLSRQMKTFVYIVRDLSDVYESYVKLDCV